MTTVKTENQKLRLLPGVIIALLIILIRYGMPIFMPDATLMSIAMMAGLAGGLAMMIWWTFFSRAPRLERFGALAMMVVVLIITSFLIDKSIQTAMMGMMYAMVALPVLSIAFVIWAIATQGLAPKVRQVLMVITIVLSCVVWVLFRSTGITGSGTINFTWRWTPTAEEQFLAEQSDDQTETTAMETMDSGQASWPGFRGPKRDSVIRGTAIATDWSTNPPTKLWERKIGPGCSSFAVKGSLVYTQEQRGKYEMVTCYNIKTGNLVWKHRDKERFWDSHAGAGPRSTPALANGHVYTFGPTGILNVLNDHDGTKVWSRNVGVENNIKIPTWALTCSPLVVDDIVIVASEGKLLAYDQATGEPRWQGPDGGKSYSSPHLMTIDGIKQVVMMSSTGLTSVDAKDGKVFWQYHWPKGERIVQPALLENGDLLIASGDGMALRRISIKQENEKWITKEKWTTSDIKPSFNDFVIHKNYIYGFDTPVLVCVNAENGQLTWRGGRYGGGQLMLLADQDSLMVISEQGELALVKADPEAYTELGRLSAIKGRVWNHPVLVNDILLLRNSEQMVAYQLAKTE